MIEGPAPNAEPPAAASLPPGPGAEATSPPIADGVSHPLDPRSVPCDRAAAWIAVAATMVPLLTVLGIVALATSLSSTLEGLLFGGALVLGVALAWIGQAWPAIAHRHAAYRVHDRGVEIRRGVWWRAEIQVPRSRIQHTDVSRSPLERRFGLATLHLFTAGTAYSRISLHGLAEERARQIRDYLIEEIQSDAV